MGFKLPVSVHFFMNLIICDYVLLNGMEKKEDCVVVSI